MAEATWRPFGTSKLDAREGAALKIIGPDDEYVKTTIAALGNINFWPWGKNLFEAMCEKKLKGVFLNIEFEANKFQFELAYASTDRIALDWRYVSKVADRPQDLLEPTQKEVAKCNKLYVYLAHELLHALHVIQGTYKQSAPGMASPPEEFATTGLFEHNDDPFTENRFRLDMGLSRRPLYFYKVPGFGGGPEWHVENEKRKDYGLPPLPNIEPRETQHTFKYGASGIIAPPSTKPGAPKPASEAPGQPQSRRFQKKELRSIKETPPQRLGR